MNTNASRRAFMAGSAVAAVAVTLPVVALAAPTADSAEWEAAMRTYEEAEREARAYDPIHDCTYKAWMAGRPSEDLISWREFFPERHTPAGRHDIMFKMDIEERWRDFLNGEEKWWWSPDAAGRKAEYRAALDSVQAYRDAWEANYRDTGLRVANDEQERLDDAAYDAKWALMNMPAPHGPALLWKLRVLMEVDAEGHIDGGWAPKAYAQTFADMNRILGGDA